MSTQQPITGWGAFGTGEGLTFRGTGSLEGTERDIGAGLDSAWCRHAFWQNCVSVHRGAGSENPVIFTARAHVLDAAGRAGFYAVAIGFDGSVLHPSKDFWKQRFKESLSLLEELRAAAVSSSSGRFVMPGRILEKFVTSRSLPFGPKRRSTAPYEGGIIRLENNRRSEYWMESGDFNPLPNQLGLLAFAQEEASLYLFEAKATPKDISIRQLTSQGVQELYAIAEESLARRAAKPIPVVSKKPVVEEQDEVGPTVTTKEIRQDFNDDRSGGSIERELAEIRLEMGELFDRVQALQNRVEELGARLGGHRSSAISHQRQLREEAGSRRRRRPAEEFLVGGVPWRELRFLFIAGVSVLISFALVLRPKSISSDPPAPGTPPSAADNRGGNNTQNPQVPIDNAPPKFPEELEMDLNSFTCNKADALQSRQQTMELLRKINGNFDAIKDAYLNKLEPIAQCAALIGQLTVAECKLTTPSGDLNKQLKKSQKDHKLIQENLKKVTEEIQNENCGKRASFLQRNLGL